MKFKINTKNMNQFSNNYNNINCFNYYDGDNNYNNQFDRGVL